MTGGPARYMSHHRADAATRFDALEALSCHGGAAKPAELRDMLHLPAQTITSVLDQLQAAGLVKRSPHPSDRRSTMPSSPQPDARPSTAFANR